MKARSNWRICSRVPNPRNTEKEKIEISSHNELTQRQKDVAARNRFQVADWRDGGGEVEIGSWSELYMWVIGSGEAGEVTSKRHGLWRVTVWRESMNELKEGAENVKRWWRRTLEHEVNTWKTLQSPSVQSWSEPSSSGSYRKQSSVGSSLRLF